MWQKLNKDCENNLIDLHHIMEKYRIENTNLNK